MSFEDIGSYSDDQVRDKIHSLSSNKEFLSFLNRILFPKLSHFFPSLFRAYIKFKFNHIFSEFITCDLSNPIVGAAGFQYHNTVESDFVKSKKKIKKQGFFENFFNLFSK